MYTVYMYIRKAIITMITIDYREQNSYCNDDKYDNYRLQQNNIHDYDNCHKNYDHYNFVDLGMILGNE